MFLHFANFVVFGHERRKDGRVKESLTQPKKKVALKREN